MTGSKDELRFVRRMVEKENRLGGWEHGNTTIVRTTRRKKSFHRATEKSKGCAELVGVQVKSHRQTKRGRRAMKEQKNHQRAAIREKKVREPRKDSHAHAQGWKKTGVR